jgi:hypothetical protein
MRLRVSALAVFSLCLVWSASVAAQASQPDPRAVQPQRPTVATHAGTVARGWIEFEAGTEVDHYDDDSHGDVTSVLAKIGLARTMQLELQAPLVWAPGAGGSGVGDFSIGVKFRLLEDAPVVADFAVQPIVKFPTGSHDVGTGTGTVDVGILLISSHDLGPVAMDLNVGYTRRSGDGTAAPKNATVWTASFGGPGYGPIGWVAELYGYPATSGVAGGDSTLAFLVGPTFRIQRWLILDAGMILRVRGPQPRAIYTGLTYNAGRLWK